MPLTFADPGVENIIKKIGGSPEVKKHLENLGFVAGGEVTMLSHYIERPEDIDVIRACEARERAEERLMQHQSKLEYYQSKASLARAMARMAYKTRFTDK